MSKSAAWMWTGLMMVIATIPFLGFIANGEPWYASDLCGQAGTIEAFRRGIEAGTLWPFDITMGLGHDALAYYGWYAQIIMGGVAHVLHLCGDGQASMHVAMWASMFVLAAIVLLGGRVAAAMCEDPAQQPTYAVGGAFAGLLWVLLPGDGYSAQGGSMISSLGLLANGIGLCWFILCLWRMQVIMRGDRLRLDPGLVIGVCMVLGSHAISAMATALALATAWMVSRGAVRWSIWWSAVLGAGLAAPAVQAVAATMWQQTTLPRDAAAGADPLSSALSGFGAVDTAIVAIAVVLVLVGAWIRWRQAPWLAAISLALVIAALLPAASFLLPSGLHRYRLLPMAGVPMLILGGPWVVQRLSGIIASISFPTRLIMAFVAAGVAMTAGMRPLLTSLPALERPILEEQNRQLATALPHGARVVMGNRLTFSDLVPHRTYVHLATHELGVISANAFHWLVSSVPMTPISVASESLYIAPWFSTAQPAMPMEQADAVLRDYGITHLVEHADADHLLPSPVEPMATYEAWTATKTPRSAGVYRVWSVDRPAPVIEPIAGRVLRLSGVPAGGWIRHWYAEWWARQRSRGAITDRIVCWPADDGADLHVPSDVIMRTPIDPANLNLVVGRFYDSLKPLADAIAREPGQASEGEALPPCDVHWDGRSFEVTGLVPGRFYLMRYAWSPSFSWQGGTASEELGGLTVLHAGDSRMVGSFNRVRHDHIWLGVCVAGASLLVALAWAMRSLRISRRK